MPDWQFSAVLLSPGVPYIHGYNLFSIFRFLSDPIYLISHCYKSNVAVLLLDLYDGTTAYVDLYAKKDLVICEALAAETGSLSARNRLADALEAAALVCERYKSGVFDHHGGDGDTHCATYQSSKIPPKAIHSFRG